MKAITRLFILTLCLLIASCGSRKHAAKSVSTSTGEQPTVVTPSAEDQQPADAKRKDDMCVTSRLRMDLSAGSKSVSVGGMLRMKRNDVIQLSIVTFGILEVARVEMTPDYFMLVDKMGKQYVKSAYGDVPFLKRAGVDFYTIQTYFWDEQKSSYSGWERGDFVDVEGRSLPTKHNITIPTGSKTIKANLTLSDFNTDSEWEKRTQLPAKYKEVTVDELVTRIMNLSL